MGQLAILLRRWWIVVVLAALGGYWLLPISGQVVVMPGSQVKGSLWPNMVLQPSSPRPGQLTTLRVVDGRPLTGVQLTIDGQTAFPAKWQADPGGTWSWSWTFVAPDTSTYPLVVYHECDTGCVERGRLVVGAAPFSPSPERLPTKLGVVFADPRRDWRGRSGWDVELTYARLARLEYWGLDDLAGRVHQAAAQGLRVLVRVDYDQGQSLPPAGDYLALTEYLHYLRRLARDDRLRQVYGYIIGSGFNASGSNSLFPERPVTPEWYARLFNGYGEPLAHTDNVVQVMRIENPAARVLVGPVRPWVADQDGTQRYAVNVPWLNYMNTLVAVLDASARAKAAAGIPLAAPDGFAAQAPGRPAAPELASSGGAQEPRIDLKRAEWGEAQAGFRVYRDWLDIVNAYSTTRGLPLYITSANTFAPDENVPPAQNYPRGWLTTALEVVNHEPQVLALCWFIDDFPHDKQWDWFSLAQRQGRLVDAAEEFDALLKMTNDQ